MIELLAHNLAPIMFVTVMAMLLLGYPVAFTLAAGGLFYFIIGVEVSHISPDITLFWNLLGAQPDRVLGVMSNDTLLAVPFFTFMGLVLERSRMAEDLLETIGQLFGPVRGGLGYAVVLVGALLAATTGVVAASVIAMGLISLPIMLRYGYDRSYATGAIAAAGTLAQIVPPSLVLIVMADQLGRSVGDMYVGALYPALIMICLYLVYTFAMTMLRPGAAPALPLEARTLGGGVWSLVAILIAAVAITVVAWYTLFSGFRSEVRDVWAVVTGVGAAYAAAVLNRTFHLGILSRLAEQVVIVLIPPLALIFLVLGTIFLGIATPTEGGAMGAAGALVLAFVKRRLSLRVLVQSLESTTKLSAFVLFILLGARVFGLTFYGINGNVWIEELLLAIPGSEYGFLITVSIIIFILGCFLDFFEIAFILVPLLAPVAQKLGIDLIWFGVLLGINLQTSFLTPPFGFSLFYLRSIAPSGEWFDKVSGRTLQGVATPAIYKGALPFILMNVLMIAIVMAFPGLVTRYRDDLPKVDLDNLHIKVPPFGGGDGFALPGSLNLGGPPSFGGPPAVPGAPAQPQAAPPASANSPAVTGSGSPPAGSVRTAPPSPAPDLSQPPVFR